MSTADVWRCKPAHIDHTGNVACRDDADHLAPVYDERASAGHWCKPLEECGERFVRLRSRHLVAGDGHVPNKGCGALIRRDGT